MMDFNQKIATTLSKKLLEGNLHQLYLIEPNYRDSTAYTLDWIYSIFRSSINASMKELDIINHQDILVIKPDTDQKHYDSNQIAAFFNFTNSEPLILKQKIIIITDYQLLSLSHQNKMLKTLEEPPINLSVFLLNPKKIEVIPTLESRSSKVRLINSKECSPEIIDRYQQGFKNFHEFDKFITSQKLNIEEIIETSIDFINLNNLDRIKAIKLKQLFLSLKDDRTFNNSNQSIKLKIFDAIHQ